jgi:predicted metalloprotease with PDZ domain
VKKLSEEEVRQLHRRGIKVLQQKDYDGAIEIFKKLAAHNAEDATARYNLACACSLKGEKAAALDALEADFKKWIADAPEPAGATPRGAPFLGVGTSGTAAGMHVLQVVQGSPAEEAGVKAGDIIVEFAGARYTNRDEFANAIRAQDTREPVTIKVLRGDELLELRVVLAPEE